MCRDGSSNGTCRVVAALGADQILDRVQRQHKSPRHLGVIRCCREGDWRSSARFDLIAPAAVDLRSRPDPVGALI